MNLFIIPKIESHLDFIFLLQTELQTNLLSFETLFHLIQNYLTEKYLLYKK